MMEVRLRMRRRSEREILPHRLCVETMQTDRWETACKTTARKKWLWWQTNTGNTSGVLSGKRLLNPYIDPVFVLRVPQAPEAQNDNLVDGDYQWQKPKVSKGIEN